MFRTCGGATIYTVHSGTALANIYGYGVLLGLGMPTTQAGYAVGPLLVMADRVPEVIQFLNISQGSSQPVGLTIASALFQSMIYSALKGVLDVTGYSNEEIQAAIARATVLETALRHSGRGASMSFIENAWILVIAAGALFTLCSCFLTRRRSLS